MSKLVRVHDTVEGGVSWQELLPGDLGGGGVGQVVTGTYTGDGAASQAITGLGFKPKYLRIYERKTTAASTTNPTITTDRIIDDHVSGMSIDCDSTFKTRAGIIISLDADGFTVGTTSTPNVSGTVYSYVAIG